ncbi:helix-turn-helix domain-containing protein [Terracidiphilus gabretensis]|uniref:helix-turn-helix domain-containing protein n=1 Tax=Terracidiphilus gabretensis TaxID=1577687 RepID=UPI00071B3F40
MNFTQMHERLRMELQRRIQRGTLSVSLLARQTGFGQSHLSNFLHGRRQLSLEAMDRILAAQSMSAADLLATPSRRMEYREGEESGAVPVVSHTTALFEPHVRPSAVQSMLHLPGGMLRAAPSRPAKSRQAWQRFVVVAISAQEAQAMEPLVLANALVLLDRHYNSLLPYRANRPNLYAVRHDARLKLRYVDFQLNRLVLRPHSIAFPVELIEVGVNETPNDLIVGRVALILNEP